MRPNWLHNAGIKELNDMQLSTIKAVAENDSLVVLSPTGTGKTLAFLIAILENTKPVNRQIKALVVVPSRELALQVESVAKKLQTGLKITACYGGHKREIEENTLLEAPAILIGTPGRLGDHLRRNNIDLSNLEFLVLDEFDKMMELGFTEGIEFIYENLPKSGFKQVVTSATNSSDKIPGFIANENAITLNFLTNEIAADTLRIHTVNTPEKDKLPALIRLLYFTGNTSSIVFCNHRDAVERVADSLSHAGLVVEFYHGGMEQKEREIALFKFRNGTAEILVTTDLASRGLDITHIRSIIHYHLPLDEAAFTHRNGRTARMNTTGNVYLLIGPDEKKPAFLPESTSDFDIPTDVSLPEKPKWSTLFIDAGKKDKINKIDIVGFLSNKGELKKDDIGLIEVKDFFSFAAIRKSKVNSMLLKIRDQKMKNKKIKMALAK